MPNRVEINYVIETETAINIHAEEHQANPGDVKLVDKLAFQKKCQAWFSYPATMSNKLWDRLLGNYPNTGGSGIHPDIHYLTEDSCNLILQHLHQFHPGGLDYQNLPAGFFVMRNPSDGLGLEVVHYSEFLANNSTCPNPLAISLTDREDTQNRLNVRLEFESPKKEWYQFLVEQANVADGPCPCTQKQLDDAFIHFANKIEASGLEFFKTSFSTETNVNPIVLLSRWDSVIFNQHLKPEDRQAQWQALPLLPLEHCYDAIRAITDHKYSKNPCGFLLPEMGPKDVLSSDTTIQPYWGIVRQYWGLHTVANDKKITNEQSFWRYISFMPRRNSIDFYRRAIKEFPKDVGTEKLLGMLAAATTGDNHGANSKEEEEKEFATWKNVCELIKGIEESSFVVKQLMKRVPAGGLKKEFLDHFTRLQNQPNIPFLNVMAQHIRDYIAGLGPQDLLKMAQEHSVLQELADLSDQLNHCVSKQGTLFYHGCRFYLVEGKWNKMSTKAYVELQHQFTTIAPSQLVLAIAPLISTFGIENVKALKAIKAIVYQGGEVDSIFMRKLTFFSTIFQDAKKPLDIDQLSNILDDLKQSSFAEDDLLAMLDYFEHQYASYFDNGYFVKKKQLIEDAASGLNAHQITLLQGYQFGGNDLSLLITIESAMVRKNPMMDDETFIQLNDQFRALSHVFMPAEFTEFLERLAALRDCMPSDCREMSTLLNHIIKKKTFSSFNVIFLRNKFEKISDSSLLSKVNQYIALEKHITEKSWSVNPIHLQETLATLILNLPKEISDKDGVDNNLTKIIDSIEAIAKQHPHAQQQIIHMVNHLIHTQDPAQDDYPSNVMALLSELNKLAGLLSPGSDKKHLDNMSFFYALISHFQENPNTLVRVLHSLSDLEQSTQRFFLVFLTRLLNSEQPTNCFEELVELCRSDSRKMELLQKYCQIPPYAPLTQLYDWLESSDFACKYERFSLSPFGQRHHANMFNRQHYNNQRERFIGVTEEIFTDAVGDELSRLLTENRSNTMDSLVSVVKSLREKPSLGEGELRGLLAAVIEILARTAHQADASSATGKCSQELNTTQVMAVYAMLLKGLSSECIINQIDTGEGKSRVMMILSACQAIQGKTVDFLTSNMTLAERDYFTYQEFFNALDIPTGLISLKTPAQLYRQGGVNFSDNSNLILLRNMSDITLSSADYLDVDKTKRCLMLDEEDKFVHDRSSHTFNYAARSKALAGFVWVYPLLVGFMQEQQSKLVDYDGDKDLIEAFLKHVSLHDSDQLHQASIANMKDKNPKQLMIWLQSALTALTLQKDIDYALTSADEDKLVPVRNVDGLTCYTRQVLVLDNGRPMEDSTYSDGVHQCICAIENQKVGKEAFVIMPENETQRSIYTHPFLKTYKSIYGVSGSTRAQAPMANPVINQQNWCYMITPREKQLRRQEKRVWAAKDGEQHIAFIKAEIIEACKSGQSFLLICRNDKQSQHILTELKKDAQLMKKVDDWQYVHGLTSPDEEKNAIRKAGNPGVITISSVGMFARGVDIRAENLKVRAAFVPTLEDEIQIMGRTGRFGKEGDYRMVINLQDEETPIDGQTYNIESRVIAAQNEMAVSAMLEEKTASMYAGFLEKVHQAFLGHFNGTNPVDRPKMLQTWQTFLDALQKDWELQRGDIKEALEHQDLQLFKNRLSDFVTKWRNQMRQQIDNGVAIPLSPQLVEQSFNSIQAHRGFFAEQTKKKMIKSKAYYDKADDGQATIYQIPFAQTIATLRGERPLFANTRAWSEGRGVLFPDLMATLNGDRPIFANLRAFIDYLCKLVVSCFKNNNERVSTPPMMCAS